MNINVVPTKRTLAIARRMAGEARADVAPCAGQWQLFDSTDPLDHREARKLCADCPLLRMCEATLRDVWLSSHALGRPAGTWAGHLIGASALDHRRSAEEEMFTDDEARVAHAAYVRGERDNRAVLGHRVWDRRYRRRLRWSVA